MNRSLAVVAKIYHISFRRPITVFSRTSNDTVPIWQNFVKHYNSSADFDQKSICETSNISFLKGKSSFLRPPLVLANLLMFLDERKDGELSTSELREVIFSLMVINDKDLATRVLAKYAPPERLNPLLFTLCMQCYNSCKGYENAISLYCNIWTNKDLSIRSMLNEYHLTSILKVCKESGILFRGVDLFQQYFRTNEPSASRLIPMSSFLSMCTSLPKNSDDAKKAFAFIISIQNSIIVHNSTYSSLIVLCGQNGRFDLAKSFFEKLESSHASPTVTTVTALLTAAVNSNNITYALQAFSNLQRDENGVQANAKTVCTFINGCIKGRIHGQGLAMILDWVKPGVSTDPVLSFRPDDVDPSRFDIPLIRSVLYLLKGQDCNPKHFAYAVRLVKYLLFEQSPRLIGGTTQIPVNVLSLLAGHVSTFGDIDALTHALSTAVPDSPKPSTTGNHPRTTAQEPGPVRVGTLSDKDVERVWQSVADTLRRRSNWSLLLSLFTRLEAHAEVPPIVLADVLGTTIATMARCGQVQTADRLLYQKGHYFVSNGKCYSRKIMNALVKAGRTDYSLHLMQFADEKGFVSEEFLWGILDGMRDPADLLVVLKATGRGSNRRILRKEYFTSSYFDLIALQLDKCGDRSLVQSIVLELTEIEPLVKEHSVLATLLQSVM